MTRRFKHSEWPTPDLIVIDGGATHLKTAQSLCRALSRNIRVISVVKDEKHKAREVLSTQNESGTSLSKELQMQAILLNSEAHRFAIEFYRKTHRKSLLGK